MLFAWGRVDMDIENELVNNVPIKAHPFTEKSVAFINTHAL